MRKKTCSGKTNCCALTPRAHLDLSPCASNKTRLLRSHARSTFGSLPVRKRTCSCDRLLRSHKEMYEHCAAKDKVGAEAKAKLMVKGASGQLLPEHTRNPRHLDLHAHTRHREMLMRQDCCARTPQAHLDLSVRKKACSGKKIVALSHREHTWISLRAQATRQDCCALTPRAHLDLSPCANGHVHATDCCVRTKRCMSTVLLKTRWVLKQRLN